MADGRVREFWDARAGDTSASDSEVTHNDVWQRWLEIETLKRSVRPTDRLLDVGCGAGYTTRLLAPLVREAVGVDYSDAMVARARAAAADIPNIRFEPADVMTLAPGTLGRFDVAVSSRCLINLSSWDDQQRAIANIAAMLQPGGRFLFLEGCADGRARLNEVREASGLDPMPTVWHNLDFAEATLLPYLDRFFTIDDRRHFGVYDFVARVVHPLAVAPEPPAYTATINAVGARLALDHQEFGGISRVIVLVLTRKADA